MSDDVLKSFLIGIGYQVDGASEAKFLTGLKHAGEAVALVATGMVAALTKVAEQLENTFFVSQRTGAAVENIKALGFAFGQMGGTAAQAQGALEGIASFLRSSPGASNWLKSLGVDTKDAQGHMRDTADITQDFGKRLAGMPFYQAKAYASVAGIDEPTLLMLRKSMGEFSDQYHKMYQAAGIDAQKAASDSHDFMNSLRGVGAAISVLGDKITSELTKRAGDDLARFRDGIVANFGRISLAVTTVAKVVLDVADGLVHLAVRAMQALGDISDWFGHLDAGTRKVIESFGLLLVAWKVLNAGFLTSPIGIVATLAAAILLLYDDYKTWKEGGKSLIDWKAWEPDIEKTRQFITWFIDKLNEGVQKIGGWQTVLEGFAAFLALKWAVGVIATIARVTLSFLGFNKAVSDAAEAATLASEGQVGRLAILAGRLAGLTAVGAGLYVLLHPSDTQSQDSENAQLGRAPGTGAMGTPGQKQQDASSDAAMRYLVGAGMPAEQAAGLVGNGLRESGLNPLADNHGHVGLFQWDAARQRAIEEHFHKKIKEMSLFEQLDAARWELSQSGPEFRAGAELGRTSLVGDAADVIGDHFERFVSHDMTPEQVEKERKARRDRANNAYLRTQSVSRPALIPAAPADVPAASGTAGAAGATINQTNNINVTGVSDPKKAADHVQSAQTRVNGNMMRNMLPAAW